MADVGFTRPTLQTLIDRSEADVNARLPGADARLRRSVLGVISRVLSGLAHGLYGFQDWIARQAIIDAAETEYLERWGVIWGVVRKAATKASGSVTFTGQNGTVVPAGSLIQRSDGVTYSTTAAATVADGSVSVQVLAETTGDAGNAASSTAMGFVSPVSGVQASGTLVEGFDANNRRCHADGGKVVVAHLDPEDRR